MRARSFAILVAALVLTLGSAALAAIVPHKVIGGKGSQYDATVNDGYITYTQYDPKRPNKNAKLYVRSRTTGNDIRVNRAGTGGANGNLEAGSDRVLYQQFTDRGSALYWFDIDSRARAKPGPINSRRWEWDPRLSATYITFLEDWYAGGTWHTRLRIYDRGSGVTRTIDSWTWRDSLDSLANSSVGDSYAAYTVCTRRLCSAYLYDATTRTTQRIPTVDGRHQYLPALDERDGLIFFVRANDACGAAVGIWQLPITLDGDATIVVDLPNGVDVAGNMFATLDTTTNLTDLYFGREVCDTNVLDVWVAPGVAPSM